VLAGIAGRAAPRPRRLVQVKRQVGQSAGNCAASGQRMRWRLLCWHRKRGKATGAIKPSVAFGDVLENRLQAAGMRVEVADSF
jgi:hypothetical protein